MFISRVGAGRLLEIRIASPFDMGEFKVLEENVKNLLVSAPVKWIACGDFRQAAVFTQDVVQALIELLRSDNPRIERSGFFVSTSAVFSMQIERILRAAGNPDRRAFRDAKDGVTWLSEVLNAEERAALHRFVFFS